MRASYTSVRTGDSAAVIATLPGRFAYGRRYELEVREDLAVWQRSDEQGLVERVAGMRRQAQQQRCCQVRDLSASQTRHGTGSAGEAQRQAMSRAAPGAAAVRIRWDGRGTSPELLLHKPASVARHYTSHIHCFARYSPVYHLREASRSRDASVFTSTPSPMLYGNG